jgi:hypothetical protein
MTFNYIRFVYNGCYSGCCHIGKLLKISATSKISQILLFKKNLRQYLTPFYFNTNEIKVILT